MPCAAAWPPTSTRCNGRMVELFAVGLPAVFTARVRTVVRPSQRGVVASAHSGGGGRSGHNRGVRAAWFVRGGGSAFRARDAWMWLGVHRLGVVSRALSDRQLGSGLHRPGVRFAGAGAFRCCRRALSAAPWRTHRLAAIAVLVFAVFGYPFVAIQSGRAFEAAQVFALTPDPIAVATLGALALAVGRSRWLAMVVPIVWVVLTGLTLYAAVGRLVRGAGRRCGGDGRGPGVTEAVSRCWWPVCAPSPRVSTTVLKRPLRSSKGRGLSRLQAAQAPRASPPVALQPRSGRRAWH